jgi:glycosyltransferase involved in cell wall biosynthesis
MAAKVPVVVADTGGLGSIVEHTKSGITTFTGDADSLSWGILEVLKNPDYATFLAANGRKRVEDTFNWPAIAQSTVGVYNRVLHEAHGTQKILAPAAPEPKSGDDKESARPQRTTRV